MSAARRVWVVGLLVVLSEPLAASRPLIRLRSHKPRCQREQSARLGQTRLRHADKPTCVAFAPDGKTFITGGDDGTFACGRW